MTIVALGCGRSQAAPNYNPKAAARDALAAFDTNGNGSLERSEAAASPGLTAAFTRIDDDQNASLSAEEIAARIQTYRAAQIGLMPFQCTVTFNGQPLENAAIVLEPEGFLAAVLKPALGTTSPGGIAAPIVEVNKSPQWPADSTAC